MNNKLNTNKKIVHILTVYLQNANRQTAE